MRKNPCASYGNCVRPNTQPDAYYQCALLSSLLLLLTVVEALLLAQEDSISIQYQFRFEGVLESACESVEFTRNNVARVLLWLLKLCTWKMRECVIDCGAWVATCDVTVTCHSTMAMEGWQVGDQICYLFCLPKVSKSGFLAGPRDEWRFAGYSQYNRNGW